MNNDLSWTFFKLWNDSLLKTERKAIEARNHIWASELGGAYIDRYLRMKGTAYTNPPNDRSLRKFQAGDIWEWITKLVLMRAGILIKSQEHLSFQYPDLLEVTGYLDHLAGGKPDWEKARAEVKSIELPEIIEVATLEIINGLQLKYGADLKQIIIEVKSCSTRIFDRIEQTGKANPHHVLQLYHYLKAKNLPEGHIVYICKDDCRMVEIGVLNPSPVEDIYKADILKMTRLLSSNVQPDKEPEILFDEDQGRFSKNWKVEYSTYLEMLYGYKTPEAYRERWDKKVASFNRTIKRVVTGANMTALNLEVIKEIRAYFPNYDELIGIATEKIALLEAESEEV